MTDMPHHCDRQADLMKQALLNIDIQSSSSARARRLLILFACAALTACGQTPPEAAPQPRTTDSDAAAPVDREAPAATVATLSGEWRVAAIDGRSLDEPGGIAISGDEASVWWEPACAGVARRYRINGGAVSFSSIGANGGRKEVCEIAPPPRLDDVLRALDEADTIARTPSNGVRISGTRHDVTLFSQ